MLVFWERESSLPKVIKDAWDYVGYVDNLDKLHEALRETKGEAGEERSPRCQHQAGRRAERCSCPAVRLREGESVASARHI